MNTPINKLDRDARTVLTLDAGGNSFRFMSVTGNLVGSETLTLPSHADNLERCLENIVTGFSHFMARSDSRPVALSFAFPGPADYPAGIIGDLPNLPAFRGGVALGPMLREKFGLPVFINNDGDLFALGEAMSGLLPHANELLARAGISKRYRNLIGVTLGTGFGGGVVIDGNLLVGDNSSAAEVWLLRNKLHPASNIERSAGIQAIRRTYAELSNIRLEESPDPRTIELIAAGLAPGNQSAAKEAYRQMGEAVGDALAQVLTVIDGIVVIGGGLSNAATYYMPALLAELNGRYTDATGRSFNRLIPSVHDIDDAVDCSRFLEDERVGLPVPGTSKTVSYSPKARTAIGRTRLGTSRAIAIGAYAFALSRLDRQ